MYMAMLSGVGAKQPCLVIDEQHYRAVNKEAAVHQADKAAKFAEATMVGPVGGKA